ncbi:aminotransferase class I/II-fold pyridoxal phosphate-dependent enzyme [Alkalibacillus silvisoli]|uniref:Aminotransferase class I/II-fold pyridoxal phosphate-dependent enzyme n=1 Tax=Alkalibacillus silvisoli TaxID=392823 RepID=A0ABP3K0U5_9BACI
MDQRNAPLYEAMQNHLKNTSYSFHVPGHKNGTIIPTELHAFNEMLAYDLTELKGLDDLHEPEGPILQAQQLAAQYYGADETYFLVNGTTSGNLAMILSVCEADDLVLVQRNSHKSIMHALDLVGAKPILISPKYNQDVQRYTDISFETVKQALEEEPNIKAIILTYPDYFGTTYDLSSVVEVTHQFNVPVLVDEAHGAHFSFEFPYPKSALQCGADLVVQSAHKSLPALTMGSFLHINSKRVKKERLAYYLQVVQSSSPSYLIMMSLDLARRYIANYSKKEQTELYDEIQHFNESINQLPLIDVLPTREGIDDPLKTVITSLYLNMDHVLDILHKQGIHVEMVDHNQLLMIHGIEVNKELRHKQSQVIVDCIKGLEKYREHDKIVNNDLFINELRRFPYSYYELKQKKSEWVRWEKAIGRVAAESIIPYPPGIPIVLNGEPITKHAVNTIKQAMEKQSHIQKQSKRLDQGVKVYINY